MKRLPLVFLLLVCAPLFAQAPDETKPTLYIDAPDELAGQLSASLSRHKFRFVVIDDEKGARYRLAVGAEPLGKDTLLRAELAAAVSTEDSQRKWSPAWSYSETVRKFVPDRAAEDVVKPLGIFMSRVSAQSRARSRADARAQAAANRAYLQAEAAANPQPPTPPRPIYQPLCCSYPFAVEATGWVIAWQGVLNEGVQDAHLVGTFSASGGSGNDIVVVVADPISLQNALSGHPAQVLYQSEQLSAGMIDVPLPGPGAYAIAFTNRFSLLSPKMVSADVSLVYTPAN